MMFKILKNMAPNDLTIMFRKCNNSNYSLRSKNFKLSLPKPITDFLKRSFFYRGAVAWNSLPSELLRVHGRSCRAYQRNSGARGKFLFRGPLFRVKIFPDIKKRVKTFFRTSIS